MKLAPEKQLFWRDLDRAQLGLAPETSVSLAEFSRAEHSLIGELEKELTLTEFKIAAQRLKINEKRAQEILHFLIASGVIIENSDFLLSTQNCKLKAELNFPILSEFCTQLALDLAQIFPIQITTSDESFVTEADHYLLRKAGLHLKKTWVFPQLLQEVRKNSQESTVVLEMKTSESAPHFHESETPSINTERHLHSDKPNAEVTSTSTQINTQLGMAVNTQLGIAENFPLELAIVHSSYASNPLLLGKLLAAGKTVINLWTEENASFLGPIFEPLSSPCPNCLHQLRLAEDPDWNNLAPQAFLAPSLKIHPFSKQLIAHELQLLLATLIFEKENPLKEKIRIYPHNSETLLTDKSSLLTTRRPLKLSSTRGLPTLEIELKAPQTCNCHTLI